MDVHVFEHVESERGDFVLLLFQSQTCDVFLEQPRDDQVKTLGAILHQCTEVQFDPAIEVVHKRNGVVLDKERRRQERWWVRPERHGGSEAKTIGEQFSEQLHTLIVQRIRVEVDIKRDI